MLLGDWKLKIPVIPWFLIVLFSTIVSAQFCNQIPQEHPSIVIFLIVKLIEIIKETRAWQLIKGIAFLIIATLISSILDFRILNYILTSFMTYGVIFLIIIFQPELRRALEQLRNK